MEKNTKIILGLLAVGTIAYLTREKWMPKATSSDSDKKSGFTNPNLRNITNPIVSGTNRQLPKCVTKYGQIQNPPCWSDRVGCIGCNAKVE